MVRYLSRSSQEVDIQMLPGIQFVLFCICMYILTRDRRSTSWFIPVSAFVMFALSTVDIAISIRLMTRDFFTLLAPNGVQIYVKAVFPKGPIFVANKSVSVLLYFTQNSYKTAS